MLFIAGAAKGFGRRNRLGVRLVLRGMPGVCLVMVVMVDCGRLVIVPRRAHRQPAQIWVSVLPRGCVGWRMAGEGDGWKDGWLVEAMEMRCWRTSRVIIGFLDSWVLGFLDSWLPDFLDSCACVVGSSTSGGWRWSRVYGQAGDNGREKARCC